MGDTALDLKAIEARCEIARAEVNRLRQGRTSWMMSVPVRDDDTDIILTDSFRDIPVLLTEVERLRQVSAKAIKQRQVEVAGALMARSETEDAVLKMYDDCQDEIERLRCELHDERIRRDEWEKMYNQAIAGTRIEQAQAELDRVLQTAQDQSDEVQELWLSPAEAEGLKRQLAKTETRVASIQEAVKWLWGFWDGNSLVAVKGFEDDVHDAWDRLLEVALDDNQT